jgi:hypothetical protein
MTLKKKKADFFFGVARKCPPIAVIAETKLAIRAVPMVLWSYPSEGFEVGGLLREY